MASRLDRAPGIATRRCSALASLPVAAGLALLAPAATPAAPASLCTTEETNLFSCPIHERIVSVCGLSPGEAEYRFGHPGRIELRARDLHIGEHGYSGGGEDQIYVLSNGYRYIVYDRTVRTGFGSDGRHHARSTSGLVVQKGDRTVSSARCGGEGDQLVDTNDAERFITTGGFIDH